MHSEPGRSDCPSNGVERSSDGEDQLREGAHVSETFGS